MNVQNCRLLLSILRILSQYAIHASDFFALNAMICDEIVIFFMGNCHRVVTFIMYTMLIVRTRSVIQNEINQGIITILICYEESLRCRV